MLSLHRRFLVAPRAVLPSAAGNPTWLRLRRRTWYRDMPGRQLVYEAWHLEGAAMFVVDAYEKIS